MLSLGNGGPDVSDMHVEFSSNVHPIFRYHPVLVSNKSACISWEYKMVVKQSVLDLRLVAGAESDLS